MSVGTTIGFARAASATSFDKVAYGSVHVVGEREMSSQLEVQRVGTDVASYFGVVMQTHERFS